MEDGPMTTPSERRRRERFLRDSDEMVTFEVVIICKGCEQVVFKAEMTDHANGEEIGEVIRDLEAVCPRHGPRPLRLVYRPPGQRSKGSFRRAQRGGDRFGLHPRMTVTVHGYPMATTKL
jgi:hypothetical protein